MTLPVIKKQRPLKRRASEGMRPLAELEDAEEAGYWRKMFKALQAERITAAEGQLYAFMEESEKREGSLKRYIRQLESDLEEAKKALLLSQNQADEVVGLQNQVEELEGVVRGSARQCDDLMESQRANKEELESLQKQVEAVQEENRLYKLMSGLEISVAKEAPASASGEGFACKVFNPETLVKAGFRISSTKDNNSNEGGMMKFEPTENAEVLPRFLHNPIEFEPSQCPALLQNVLKAIFSE